MVDRRVKIGQREITRTPRQKYSCRWPTSGLIIQALRWLSPACGRPGGIHSPPVERQDKAKLLQDTTSPSWIGAMRKVAQPGDS